MKNITLWILTIFCAVSCTGGNNEAVSPSSGNGTSGSMARFALLGDYLYAITDNGNLQSFNVQETEKPLYVNSMYVGWNLETIFPYQNKLFIGSQNGMYIMSTTNPTTPELLSNYLHVTACDPVVAQGNYAYVTLRSGRTCNQIAPNQLEVIDISNPRNPLSVNTMPMTSPQGLGIDGAALFVCDNGLKIFDASNPNNLVQKANFNINAHDVIPMNGNLMAIGNDGLYQYSYTDSTIELLSKIKIISL